jgi:hypothetical protein
MTTTADPATALTTLADTLALDGYELAVDVVQAPQGADPGTVLLTVAAGPEACEECLVPQDIFAAIAGDSLGSGWTIQVKYPTDH